MTLLRSLLALAGLALQACATTSAGRFDPEVVPRLARGAAGHDEVRAWFGEPADTERSDRPALGGACVEAWYWSNPTQQTFQNLAVYFDARGAVCGYRFSGPPRPRVAHVPELRGPAARRYASRAR